MAGFETACFATGIHIDHCARGLSRAEYFGDKAAEARVWQALASNSVSPQFRSGSGLWHSLQRLARSLRGSLYSRIFL